MTFRKYGFQRENRLKTSDGKKNFQPGQTTPWNNTAPKNNN